MKYGLSKNDRRTKDIRAARQNQRIQQQYTLSSSGDVKQITKIEVGTSQV